MKEKKRIYSLAGLKVIAIWLIFWWHSWIVNPPCDLGARCCEFFFVASGFFVYYTQGSKQVSCTWGDSARYVQKKLINIWPMHFLGFILCLCSMSIIDIFTRQTLILGLINLSLLQSWINIEQVFFSFNGPSWFLSSLLFCYFITPLLLRLLRTRKKVLLLFPMTFIVRYAIEEIQFFHPNTYWNFNIHVSPIIRMLEFFMGIMIGCIWSIFHDFLKNETPKQNFPISFFLFSILELVTVALTVIFCLSKQNSWGRDIFVLWFCFVVFIFAFDDGILSRILMARPIQWFASLQFEFFIFHIPVLKLVSRYIEPMGFSGNALSSIAFIIVIIVSLGYHHIIKKPAENCMNRILKRCLNYIVS